MTNITFNNLLFFTHTTWDDGTMAGIIINSNEVSIVNCSRAYCDNNTYEVLVTDKNDVDTLYTYQTIEMIDTLFVSLQTKETK